MRPLITSHIIKETWTEWRPWVPVGLLSACWEGSDEISEMCSLGKHNQVDTLVLFLSCQQTSLVNFVHTQSWVCNLLCTRYYQNCLQTRALQLLRFTHPMPERGQSVNRASQNHFRFWTQMKERDKCIIKWGIYLTSNLSKVELYESADILSFANFNDFPLATWLLRYLLSWLCFFAFVE